jgi:capsular exopolysaccharide synthesis family protein
MRRAGHHQDDEASIPDDTAFDTGEEGIEQAPEDHEPAAVTAAATAEPEPVIRGELVPQTIPAMPIAAATFERDSGDEIRFKDVLRIIFRRKWIALGIVAACLAVAVAYNYTAERIYQARARVLIDANGQDIVPFRSGSGADPSRFDYFVTQLEVLKSRAVAKQALERLKELSPDPATQSGQIARLLGALGVSPVKGANGDTRVVDVTYQSTNPERAAQMSNAIADAYVAQNLENLQRGGREASESLKKSLAELREEASAAESRLQAYREQQDALSLEDRQNIVLQRLKQLDDLSTNAETTRAQKESLYRQITSMKESGASLDSFPMIQANGVIQSRKADLDKLRSERSQALQTFLPTAQEVVKIDTAIADAQRQLDSEFAKATDAIKNDFEAAAAYEKKIKTAREEQSSEIQKLGRKSVPYSALQREATSSQQILQAVMQRLKETTIVSELPTNNIRVLDQAEVPAIPISPNTSLNIALALIAGIFFALVCVFGLEYLNPSLANAQDISAALGLPLLGSAPKVSNLSDGPAVLTELPAAFQEAIRGIRTQILLTPAPPGGRTLAVTSSRPGEGKTVVSTSLAISMAMAGRRVLLIDCDLRRAQLQHVFGISRGPGLTNIINAQIKPSQALVESPVKGLFILPAGDETAAPGDLLDRERLNQLIHGLKQVFDVVIVDAPPVLAVSDAAIIANAVNSVVFVVGSGTSREVAQQAIERLSSGRAQILGVVLNKAKGESSVYYDTYYATRGSLTNA